MSTNQKETGFKHHNLHYLYTIFLKPFDNIKSHTKTFIKQLKLHESRDDWGTRKTLKIGIITLILKSSFLGSMLHCSHHVCIIFQLHSFTSVCGSSPQVPTPIMDSRLKFPRFMFPRLRSHRA